MVPQEFPRAWQPDARGIDSAFYRPRWVNQINKPARIAVARAEPVCLSRREFGMPNIVGFSLRTQPEATGDRRESRAALAVAALFSDLSALPPTAGERGRPLWPVSSAVPYFSRGGERALAVGHLRLRLVSARGTGRRYEHVRPRPERPAQKVPDAERTLTFMTRSDSLCLWCGGS